jgi:uncharacterized protein
MLTKKEICRILNDNLTFLASEYGVRRIGLFGSYATDTASESSDIDLVVEFSRPIGFRFLELSEHLENLLGKPVEILTPTGIQGIRLRHIAQNIQETLVYV